MTSSAPLTSEEQAKLDQHEQTISKGLKCFLDVAIALASIKEQRLYRARHGTFEEYCHERLDIGRQYAYRLIAASRVMSTLSPIGDKYPLPQTESQIRPMENIEDAHLIQTVWMKALEEAGNRRVTRQHVKRALLKLGAGPTTRPPKPVELGVYWEQILKILKKLIKASKRCDTSTVAGLMTSLQLCLERTIEPADCGQQAP